MCIWVTRRGHARAERGKPLAAPVLSSPRRPLSTLSLHLLTFAPGDKTVRTSAPDFEEGEVLLVPEAADFTEAVDPIALFRLWFDEASAAEPNDPEAMTLATVDDDGMPDARMLLCKAADERGLVFYTNVESVKGAELAAHPKAAALFHWKSLRRQVRFRGPVTQVTDAENDAYFASRPRDSRIGAWASQQSRPLESRAALLSAVEEHRRRFDGGEVPRPNYWRGYRLTPVEIEFWRNGAFRLHDRVRFTRPDPRGKWRRQRLFP